MKPINTPIKALCFWCFTFLFFKQAHAQLTNKGALITITSGAVVYTEAAFTNTANGTVTNSGTIISNADIINDAGSSLSGNGIYSVQGNFTNNGTFNQGTSTLNFFGSLNSTIQNITGKIFILQVSKAINNYLSLADNETVFKSVDFINDRNFVRLNNKTITLGNNCVINNYSNNRYFITNGNGLVNKTGIGTTAFTFPVGFDRFTYNPLTITENGTADAYSVRCLQHAFVNGSGGDTISSNGINASWYVSEAVAGGANAIIQAQWKKNGDELSGFDYTHCEVVRYATGGWNFTDAKAGVAKQVSGYRTISRGLTSFGYITVLSAANPTFAKNTFSVYDATAVTAALKVYPTIVQNNINIDVPFNKAAAKMNITIMNADGKAVWQKQNADFNSQKIFIPDFASGIYLVTINYDNKQFVQKIIISH